MVDFDKITYYNTQIKLLLHQHPELIALQNEIDEKLKDVTDKIRRQQIIQEMMLNKWYEITKVNLNDK